MSLKCHKTVWPLDRRWLRVEYRDHSDQPLGYVNFEPNPEYEQLCTPRSGSRNPSGYWIACSIASVLIAAEVFLAIALTG